MNFKLCLKDRVLKSSYSPALNESENNVASQENYPGNQLIEPTNTLQGHRAVLPGSPSACLISAHFPLLLEITIYKQTPGLVVFLPLLSITQYVIYRRTCPELTAGAGVLLVGHLLLRHEDKSAAILEKDQ